jgi:hypothetical protein
MRREVKVAPRTAGALSLVCQPELQQSDRKGRETVVEFAATRGLLFSSAGQPDGDHPASSSPLSPPRDCCLQPQRPLPSHELDLTQFRSGVHSVNSERFAICAQGCTQIRFSQIKRKSTASLDSHWKRSSRALLLALRVVAGNLVEPSWSRLQLPPGKAVRKI